MQDNLDRLGVGSDDDKLRLPAVQRLRRLVRALLDKALVRSLLNQRQQLRLQLLRGKRLDRARGAGSVTLRVRKRAHHHRSVFGSRVLQQGFSSFLFSFSFHERMNWWFSFNE